METFNDEKIQQEIMVIIQKYILCNGAALG